MKSIIKNKKGASLAVILVIVALVVVLGGFIYWNVTQRALEEDEIDPLACGDSTGKLTINDYSAIAGGTDPGAPTYTASVNDGVFATTVTSGTTTFPIGAKIEVLASIGDYLDEMYTVDAMPCGGLTIEAPMYYSTSDNPGIRVKNDDGDFMTDAAGTGTNQTDLTAGETLQLEVEFSGTSLEASGNGIWIIEFPTITSSNITSVTLDGQTPISLPTLHVLQNAGSKAVAFEIPSIIGGVKETKLLEISLGGASDLTGCVLTDWYAKQKFIDDDKTIAYGVEDSDGTIKYENTLDSDFCISAE